MSFRLFYPKIVCVLGASSRQLASDITENPHQYRVYSGALAGQSQNISRYDLPDPGVYREFFRYFANYSNESMV